MERFEWQLRTLKEVLSADGNRARAELLKEHADEDACALVLSILDKVRSAGGNAEARSAESRTRCCMNTNPAQVILRRRLAPAAAVRLGGLM